MVIRDTLCQALAKPVIKAAEDQAKTACGNLLLCVGLKDNIEGETHAVEQSILERSRVRRREEE